MHTSSFRWQNGRERPSGQMPPSSNRINTVLCPEVLQYLTKSITAPVFSWFCKFLFWWFLRPWRLTKRKHGNLKQKKFIFKKQKRSNQLLVVDATVNICQQRLAQQFYDVIIRGAMLIDMSSWKRSLQAYGIRTSEIWKIKEIITDPPTDQGCPNPIPSPATTSPHS